MRDHRSLRGFSTGLVSGVLIGLLLGSAGMAGAAFGYKGWQTFSDEFKTGYVTGFLGMANLARNLDPGGWVDSKYPQFPKVKPLEWVILVDDLYKMPENQGYSINSILQSAAHQLELKYGKPATAEERTKQRMAHQLEILRKQREKAGLLPKDGEPKADSPASKAVTPPAAGGGKNVADERPPRKWCRCDGTDPKEARAQRKAAAAAAEAGEAPAGGKTPPAAAKPPVPASK
jgi:hypothetical protein